MTPDWYHAKASEAAHIAQLCSLGKDRERLLQEAAEWRRRAEQSQARDAVPPPAEKLSLIASILRKFKPAPALSR